MRRYVAFLRAINIGGRRVTNADLRGCFEQLDLEEVSTFRASGNVIFDDATKDDADGVTARVEAGLERTLGFEVVVFLRTAAQVRAVAAHEAFDAKTVAASQGRNQVAFLLRAPTAAQRREILALGSDDDRLALKGRELYWLPSGGTQESELDMKTIADVLGPMTLRTAGTVREIAAKYV